MTKKKMTTGRSALDAAAKVVGRTVGQVASTVKRLKTQVVKRAKKAARTPKTIAQNSSDRLSPRKSRRPKHPKRRSTARKPSKRNTHAFPGVATTRRLQTAHVKRRQAHISSQGRAQQARRDKKR